jgi:hypothetical protein
MSANQFISVLMVAVEHSSAVSETVRRTKLKIGHHGPKIKSLNTTIAAKRCTIHFGPGARLTKKSRRSPELRVVICEIRIFASQNHIQIPQKSAVLVEESSLAPMIRPPPGYI